MTMYPTQAMRTFKKNGNFCFEINTLKLVSAIQHILGEESVTSVSDYNPIVTYRKG